MVKPDLIQKRLRKLDEYIHMLEKLRANSRESILNDPFIYGNVERYLQLAIQAVIDVCNHVLADRNINGVFEYRDMIERMGKENLLPEDYAKRIASMAGLRNILVHEYLEIDRDKLYNILQTRLNDFKEFGKHIAKMI